MYFKKSQKNSKRRLRYEKLVNKTDEPLNVFINRMSYSKGKGTRRYKRFWEIKRKKKKIKNKLYHLYRRPDHKEYLCGTTDGVGIK